MTPPNKPSENCTLPMIALAVPARAPCLDIANAIEFGPVKPIPATVINKPIMTINNDGSASQLTINSIEDPITCIDPPICKRR